MYRFCTIRFFFLRTLYHLEYNQLSYSRRFSSIYTDWLTWSICRWPTRSSPRSPSRPGQWAQCRCTAVSSCRSTARTSPSQPWGRLELADDEFLHPAGRADAADAVQSARSEETTRSSCSESRTRWMLRMKATSWPCWPTSGFVVCQRTLAGRTRCRLL